MLSHRPHTLALTLALTLTRTPTPTLARTLTLTFPTGMAAAMQSTTATLQTPQHSATPHGR